MPNANRSCSRLLRYNRRRVVLRLHLRGLTVLHIAALLDVCVPTIRRDLRAISLTGGLVKMEAPGWTEARQLAAAAAAEDARREREREVAARAVSAMVHVVQAVQVELQPAGDAGPVLVQSRTQLMTDVTVPSAPRQEGRTVGSIPATGDLDDCDHAAMHPLPVRGRGDAPYRCTWCAAWRCQERMQLCGECQREYANRMATAPPGLDRDRTDEAIKEQRRERKRDRARDRARQKFEEKVAG